MDIQVTAAITGAIAGGTFSLVSYWVSFIMKKRFESRQSLRSILRVIGDRLYREQSSVYSIIDPQVFELESAINNMADCCWFRGGDIRRNGRLLIGFANESTGNSSVPPYCRSYPSSEKAKQYVETLLSIIGYK